MNADLPSCCHDSPGPIPGGSSGLWPVTIEAKFIFSAVWTLPLMLHMFHISPWLHHPYVQLILCLPVFVLALSHFGRSAVVALRAGRSNMDVLIIIGVCASFVYSLYGTLLNLGPDYLFYETAAAITTLVLFGNLLEKMAIRKTTSAVEDLTKLQVPKARKIIRELGREKIIDIDSEWLLVGDLVLVNSGDKLPADGTIEWGTASIREDMITGESMPVDKKAGSRVIGGTLVADGSVRVRLDAVGQNTVYASMLRLVKEAASNNTRIQRLADRLSEVFVPVVVAIAVLTLIISLLVIDTGLQTAFLRAVAVLVIACPCAMGLATPTAIIVGVGKAARNGILIKGGATLEKLAQVNRIVFDKTGTITGGVLKLGSINTSPDRLEHAKSIIHALERHSSHPIARSLTQTLTDSLPIELSDVAEQKGLGVEGRDAHGNQYKIGSRLILPESVAAADDPHSHDLYLLKNGELLATVDLVEQLKPNARSVIEQLKALQIETVLLSGDRLDKCQSIASSVGIDRVLAEHNPEEKLKVIEALEAESLTAFVGDGINDAPALARAAVGISLSDATEAAMHSAQVVLLSGNLGHLLKAVVISRMTLTTIKQNLFWAFFYNAVAIPAAAAGFLSPMIAALAMAFSDVIVIGNSLRLRARRLKVRAL